MDLGEEDHRDKVLFSSHHIKNTCCGHNLWLSILTFITWQNYTPLFPLPSSTLRKEVIMCIPHLSSGELHLPSFRVEYLQYLFGFFPAGLMSRWSSTGSGWVLCWHFQKYECCWGCLLVLCPSCDQPNCIHRRLSKCCFFFRSWLSGLWTICAPGIFLFMSSRLLCWLLTNPSMGEREREREENL